MSRLVGFISFAFGAAVASAMADSRRDRKPLDLRQSTKEALRLLVTIRDAAAAAEAEFAEFQAEARAFDARAQARAGRHDVPRRIILTLE